MYFQKMEYQYVAISNHPDDVISLSTGEQAEIHAFAHYKGTLRRGLNTSPSGVQKDTESITEDGNTTNDEISCSSSSGTAQDANTSYKNTTDDDDTSVSETENDSGTTKRQDSNDPVDPDFVVMIPRKYGTMMYKRCRSRVAIRRRRQLYKQRKYNQMMYKTKTTSASRRQHSD